MKAFIDTSSLLKRFIVEDGSEKINQLLPKYDVIYVSFVTQAEFFSALMRKLNNREIGEEDFRRIENEAVINFSEFREVLWSQEMSHHVIEVIKTFRLRALDSFQLTSYLHLENTDFIVSDKALCRAGEKLKGRKMIFV